MEHLSSEPSSRYISLIKHAGPEQRLRYVKTGFLGQGTSATVEEVVDVDSGEMLAVKIIDRPQHGFMDRAEVSLWREIKTFARVSHGTLRIRVSNALFRLWGATMYAIADC